MADQIKGVKMLNLDELHFVPHSSFQSLFEQQEVKELWAFLKTPNNLIRIDAALYLGKSPLEVITPNLLTLYIFSDDVDKSLKDRYKKICGAFIKAIANELGYSQNQSRIKLKASTVTRPQLFSTSTTYSKKAC
ncbi:MAG: hypothetical protein ACI9LG_000588 [Moritella dasanensis]